LLLKLPVKSKFYKRDELNKKIDEAFNRPEKSEDLEVKVNG